MAKISKAIKENDHRLTRIKVVSFLSFLVIGLFIFSLFDRSILKNQYYLALARGQQVAIKNIPPERGRIFVTDPLESDQRALLSESVERFALSVTPKNVPKEAYDRLSGIFKLYVNDLSEEEIKAVLTKDSMYAPPLKHGLTKNQVEEIAAKINPKLKINFDEEVGDILYFTDGVMFIREFYRFYPEDSLASHIVGFVDREGNGQYGVEGYFNLEMKGSSGAVAIEKDNTGELLDRIGSIRKRNGVDLVLTIDKNVQYFVEKKLKEAVEKYAAQSGTVVIMNPQTGAVVAMASYPSYNPNEFSKVEYALFLNPASEHFYEAGSVIKSFTVAAALDLGLVTPETKNDFPEMVKIGSFEIHNVGDKAYPKSTITGILDNSINTGAVWLAEKLGRENLYNYLSSFGFGQKTGIELSGEISGKLVDYKKWRDVDLATISFGQGMAVTPIQLTAAYAALVNGGRLFKPYIVKEKIVDGQKVFKTRPQQVRQVISPETSAKMRTMLQHVVEYGHAKHAAVPGYKVAGKTGTAQIPVGGQYSEEETNQTFVGIIPINEPRLIMSVWLQKPKNSKYADGSTVYVFSDIAKFVMNYWQIAPTP